MKSVPVYQKVKYDSIARHAIDFCFSNVKNWIVSDILIFMPHMSLSNLHWSSLFFKKYETLLPIKKKKKNKNFFIIIRLFF